VRVAFSVQSPSALRNFEPVVRLLGERGHETTILLHTARHAEGADTLLERLTGEVPGLTVVQAAHDTQRGRLGLGADVRASLDLLHFLSPRFNETYRERSLRRAPRLLQRFAASPLVRLAPLRAALRLGLRALDRALPVAPEVSARLSSLDPDVLLLTPYIGLRTIQPEYLRAARSLGLPAAVCVASWDNLTSKSLLRPVPDRVVVWNETQQAEAVELHGVPAGRVVVTGAQSFDQWFEREPRPRASFLAGLGLDPERPLVLYVCFTPFVRAANQDEAGFVQRWLAALRRSDDPVLAGANVLVRPHPKRLEPWRGVELGGRAIVWPREAPLPTDEASKSDYFDSLVHADAVVGLNSTAMVEAGSLGRPVLTVLAPEFRESQEGTLHFRYLLEVGGGLLRVSRSLEEHVAQLAETVRGEDAGAAERSRRFVEAFVRPHGADVAATPVFVDAIEALAASRPRRGERLPLPPT
jgi:hypothetical protein